MKICIHSPHGYQHLLMALLVVFQLSACLDPQNNGYEVGSIPETVTPFWGANSEFDDFNSGPAPILDGHFPFYFSSNRATQGGTFDIESMDVYYYMQNDGVFSMIASPASGSMIWPGTNSPSNEYGPTIVDLPDNRTLYFYASDVSGNLDIYHIVKPGDGIVSSNALNSMNDDAYPTFGPDSAVYFTSNRGGDFDIYRADIPSSVDIPTWLESSGNTVITRVDALSTANNDKCPYINGKLLVFTSDRPGGYGGFDLYYSTYGPDGWSAPMNFGPSINTAYDEYRPIVVSFGYYSNDLMIFSSNRPGGMGGFDLYYVGIPKMIK